MKKLILLAIIFGSTLTIAQNNLFKNISTTDQYQLYKQAYDKNNDGLYEISGKGYVVKFETKYLSTGEGYIIKSFIQNEGDKKGKVHELMNAATSRDYTCNGYPFESMMKSRYSKTGFVSIGNYIFKITGVSKNGTSFSNIDDVYIKVDLSSTKKAEAEKMPKKKKKKLSFFKQLKALKNKAKSNSRNFGPEHKVLEGENLDKLITDYLVVMKSKQDGRTTKQKQSDKNIINAKKKEEQKIKQYNDSVRATPEHQDLQRRIKRNEANYQAAKAQNSVTLRNKGSRTIYVGTSGSANKGTEIRSGATASWNCDQDAYIMIETIKGSTYSYRSSKTKVYTANSGCGNTVNVR